MERKIEAVAFDMDGLMFNSEDIYWEVGSRLMGRRGFKYSNELCRAIMGRPPRECFETMIGWHDLDDHWEALSRESEEIFISLIDDMLRPMPGLVELLDTLERHNMPKAICTSSSRNVLNAVLDKVGWHDRFLFSLTAQDITHGKPDPEIYLTAAGRFGIAPHLMAALEDSQTGCLAAADSGAVTIAVPGPHSADHDFSPATLIAEGLGDPRLYAILGVE